MNSNNSAPSPTTQRIALTGGIGSGKSHVCAIIARTGAPIFYADTAAKHIIRTDQQVRAALTDLVGAEVYDAQGQLVKSKKILFGRISLSRTTRTARKSTPLCILVWSRRGAIL